MRLILDGSHQRIKCLHITSCQFCLMYRFPHLNLTWRKRETYGHLDLLQGPVTHSHEWNLDTCSPLSHSQAPYEESHLGTRLLSLVLFPDFFFSVHEKLPGNEINLSLHQTVVLGTVGSPLLLEFRNSLLEQLAPPLPWTKVHSHWWPQPLMASAINWTPWLPALLLKFGETYSTNFDTGRPPPCRENMQRV